jgi:hypothetical protein
VTPAEIDRAIGEGRHLVPDRYWPGLQRYFVDSVRPGGFLEALLKNDLMVAVCKIDEDMFAELLPLVRFLYNFAPPRSHGSPDKVEAWLAEPAREPAMAGRWDSAR